MDKIYYFGQNWTNFLFFIINQTTKILFPFVVNRMIEQFKEDMYEDGNNLFCKFCQHSIEHNRVHTIKLHLQSEKHKANKSKAQKIGSAT